MTPELTTLLTALATDVDDIRIVFEESSLTTLKIVIGAILFGIALDTDVQDFVRAAKRPGTIAIGWPPSSSRCPRSRSCSPWCSACAARSPSG